MKKPGTAVGGARWNLLRRALTFLVAETDALPLRVFEVLFTLSFLTWMGNNFLTGREWLTAEGFHLGESELAALGYPNPWPLLPGWALPFLALAIAGFSTCVLGNRFRRIGLIGCFLCALYVQRADYMGAFTLNKLFVGIYALLALAPGVQRDKSTGGLLVSAAPIRVIQATLILQYLAAGWSKIDPGNWDEYTDVLWADAQGVYRTEVAAWMLRNLPKWAWSVMQYVSLAFELGAPLWFTVRRLRPVAFIVGLGFHWMIALLMKDLIFFSFQMWSFYALFVSAAEWRALGRWFARRLRAVAGSWASDSGPGRSA